MNRCLCLALLAQIVLVSAGLSQNPSVQLQVKKSSGFLGLGGARFVELRLSNETRQEPLSSVNVNAGQLYFFVCTPLGDWQLDAGFVKDNLSKLTIEQSALRESISYTSDVRVDGDTTSVLIGFSKSLRIQEPFLFRIQSGDAQNQVQFTVPKEYWPGYEIIENLWLSAERAFAASQFPQAISYYRAIITNSTFQMFPLQAESRLKLIQTFQAYLDANTATFQALKDSTQLDAQKRIAKIAQFRPVFMYVIDSLPPLRFDLASKDSSVSNLLDQARNAFLRIGSVTDSLQNSLDERTVEWILDGSATGKTGMQYQLMIESLAYAYSSLDFTDTSATRLTVSIPPQIQSRLEKNNLVESYNTFVRVCSDRYQMRLALFPVDFLPNLRKDTAAFPLPFYSMLKAVADYYAGNLLMCRDDIGGVFRTCFVKEFLFRFDSLRVIVNSRLKPVPANVFRLLGEGRALQAQHNIPEAADKYREAVIIAPDFASASFALGELNVESGDTAMGLSLYQKAYQLDTLYLTAYLASYDLYRLRRDQRSVIGVLSTALARGNDYWVTNDYLGRAYMANAEPQLALKPFRRALDLNPQSYETCIQLGQAYQATKDFLKAREYFNNAIEIDALRKEAVDALNKLNEEEHSIR
jgi:tetratricopeptide (TPR) repeat protein